MENSGGILSRLNIQIFNGNAAGDRGNIPAVFPDPDEGWHADAQCYHVAG